MKASVAESVRSYLELCEDKGINAILEDGMSVVERAAMNQEYDVVDALINDHGANRGFAILGFARIGEHDEVERHIAQGGNRDYAVSGCARSGSHDKVEEHIALGGNRNNAVLGCAKAKNYRKVEEHIALGGRRDFAVLGCASIGDFDKVEEHIKLGGNLDQAVIGAAIFGDHDKVNEYIGRGGNRDRAIYGYTKVGNHAKVHEHITLGGDRNEAVFSYAAFGCHERVRLHIGWGGGKNNALLGYARAHNHKKVMEYVEEGVDIICGIKGYLISKDWPHLRDLLMHYNKEITFDNTMDYTKAEQILKRKNAYYLNSGKWKASLENDLPLYMTLDDKGHFFSTSQIVRTQVGMRQMARLAQVSKGGLADITGDLPEELRNHIRSYVIGNSIMSPIVNEQMFREINAELHKNQSSIFSRAINFVSRTEPTTKIKSFVEKLREQGRKENTNYLNLGRF